MKKIIVRGTRGFLGSAFVRACFSRGFEILDAEIKPLPYDLSNYIVVNFAWHGTSGVLRADYKEQLNNVYNSLAFMEKVCCCGCTEFINAGSIMEMEISKGLSRDGYIPSINSFYSIAKLTTDYMLRTYALNNGINYKNAVISNIYGPGEKSERFINTMLRKMLQGDNIDLTSGEQLYDFIYIDDAIDAFFTIIEKGNPNENFYIGNKTQRKLKEFVMEMNSLVDKGSILNFGTLDYNGVEIDYDKIDTGKLERLGFKPKYSFEKGIQKTIDRMIEENG